MFNTREMAISCLVLLDHPTQYPVNRKIWAQQATKEYTQICGTLNIGIFALNLKGKRNSLCFQISWWNSPEMHKYIDRERLESGERLNSKILLPLWWYYAAAASKKKKYSKGQPALSCNFCVLYKNQTGKHKLMQNEAKTNMSWRPNCWDQVNFWGPSSN